MTNKEFMRWFSGFLDGEGSFSVRFHIVNKGNNHHIKVFNNRRNLKPNAKRDVCCGYKV